MSTIQQDNDQRLRPMREADLPAVVRIEKRAHFFAWSKRFFRTCLRRHVSCWVLEQAGVILGYSVMSVSEREAHIMNISVRPNLQGQGLGRKLLTHLLMQARRQGANMAVLEVRSSNRPARYLYQSAGFTIASVRNGYYLTRTACEDALIMARSLGQVSD